MTTRQEFMQAVSESFTDSAARFTEAMQSLADAAKPTPCPAKDLALGNCSGELGHTGDHYLTTIYGRANWGNDEEDDTEPERACVICGTPENGVYTSWNRCCSDPDNIEEV